MPIKNVTEYAQTDGRVAEAPKSVTEGGMQMSAPTMTKYSSDRDMREDLEDSDPVDPAVDAANAAERVDQGNNGTSGPLSQQGANDTLDQMAKAARFF